MSIFRRLHYGLHLFKVNVFFYCKVINNKFEKLTFKGLINFDFLADFGLISEEDLKIFKYADTASEAWEIIDSNKLSKNKL